MKQLFVVIAIMLCLNAHGQTLESIPYGDFDSWQIRQIRESAILGGEVKTVYAIAPSDTIVGQIPYTGGRSSWSTSNVLAKVSGVVKTSNSVFPEQRESGRCARMETVLVNCKVLGMFNINVVASGSIFLGRTLEPIKNVSDPYQKLDIGIAFTKRPQALIFDYAAKISTDGILTKATGMSINTLKGTDPAEIFILLQQRKEDAEGNITAKRVGTAKIYITKSTYGWVNSYSLPIVYGDQGAKQMPLQSTYNAQNSKGEMVQVIENTWANDDTKPTHMVIMFSSGSKGAYTGALGNWLKVDNIKLRY